MTIVGTHSCPRGNQILHGNCSLSVSSQLSIAVSCHSSFATTCKDHPVQLWDAFDLQKRASYSPHNQLVCLPSLHSSPPYTSSLLSCAG